MILPVFGLINNERRQFGSAFILCSGLLITAGHNLRNDFEERFDAIFVEINSTLFYLNDPIFQEYKSIYNNKIDNYHDLAIFKTGNNFANISELTLSSELPYEVVMSGFIVNEYRLEKIESRIDSKEYSYRSYTPFDVTKSIKFENCFYMSQATEPGLSGGPVLNDSKVVGMVVYGDGICGTSAIKASYIIDKINEMKI